MPDLEKVIEWLKICTQNGSMHRSVMKHDN